MQTGPKHSKISRVVFEPALRVPGRLTVGSKFFPTEDIGKSAKS